MSETKPFPDREFQPEQLVQAMYVGRVTNQHRAERRYMGTHAIDNVAPEIISDRDDGIFVEAQTDAAGGYCVHVTIADVAAHVRPGSPLANAAWQRGFTVYRPGSTDPMFPRTLEESLSLEHHQERLGLTVNITLDSAFNPILTSFTPVITKPDNVSYEQTHIRIGSDPQFTLMSKIADGIKHGYLSSKHSQWEDLQDGRSQRRGYSSSEMNAMNMVATYMLLANGCVADFFNKTDLPFLYRNFDGSDKDNNAYYATKSEGHTAVQSMGIQSAYCHFTSPIRRAPDYFNAVMAHYTVNVLTTLENRLLKEYPSLNKDKLHHALWKYGSEILEIPAHSQNTAYPRSREKLRNIIMKALYETSPDLDVTDRSLIKLAITFDFPPLPLSKSQLDEYAEHMNALMHSPQMRQNDKLNERHDESSAQIASIKQSAASYMNSLSPEKFSSLIQAAAITGEMPRSLFNEAIERLKNNNYDKVIDGYAIFIQAQYPESQRWKALKGSIAQAIKNDPGTVNVLLEKLRERILPATINEQTARQLKTKETPGHPDDIHNALIVLHNEDNRAFSAPFYSVGHDYRAALSHARYSFLEHYAFGQLQPIEQTVIPNLLYADMDAPGVNKRQLFNKMVEDIGANLAIRTNQVGPDLYHTTVTVDGDDIEVPIITKADEQTSQIAVETAIRRMLRDDSFKIAVGRNQTIAENTLNPQTVLTDIAMARGIKVSMETEEIKTRANAGFRATFILDVNGNKRAFSASGPNKDRAIRTAAAKALTSMDWSPSHQHTEQRAESWATEEMSLRFQTGPKRGSSAKI